MAYYLREREAKNYKDKGVEIPRNTRRRAKEKLYPVEVLEEDKDEHRFRVHYIGYDEKYDEWIGEENIETLQPQLDLDDCPPFHLHTELAYKIKLALNSSNRADPDTRIELSFDKFLFAGGLQQCGRKVAQQRGHTVYGITSYASLAPLLGDRWHIRVINDRTNFCYALLESVRFHLHYRKPLLDYQPDCGTQSVNGGCMLVFRFVRMDGVKMEWDDVISIK